MYHFITCGICNASIEESKHKSQNIKFLPYKLVRRNSFKIPYGDKNDR